MAFDPDPGTWLGGGYSLDTGSHTARFQTADAATNKTLPQLTDALGHATTGDIRVVAFAIAEALYQAWVAQGVNVPTKMTIGRSAFNLPTGGIRYTYTLNFTVTPPAGAYAITAE